MMMSMKWRNDDERGRKRKKKILHLNNIWDRKNLIRDRDRNLELQLLEQHLDRAEDCRAIHFALWRAHLAPSASKSRVQSMEDGIQLCQCYKPEAEQEEEERPQEAVKVAQVGPRLQLDQSVLLQEEREQEGLHQRREQEE
jgi:hypothetical protein